MKIAIVLFEHCTALDAVGPYEVLSRWPGGTVHMVGEQKGVVRTDTEMLGLHVDTTYAEIPDPDIIMVPGGYGQRDHRDGSALQAWLHPVQAEVAQVLCRSASPVDRPPRRSSPSTPSPPYATTSSSPRPLT